MKNKVLIGKIGKTHGLNGSLRLYSYCQPIDSIIDYPTFFEDGSPFEPDSWTDRHGYLLVKIAGYDTPEDARALVNRLIFTERHHFPPAEDGSYYWFDLMNCDVYNDDKTYLGKVSVVTNHGAHDILCIEHENTETLIPFVDKHVLTVDLNNKTITVRWKSI